MQVIKGSESAMARKSSDQEIDDAETKEPSLLNYGFLSKLQWQQLLVGCMLWDSDIAPPQEANNTLLVDGHKKPDTLKYCKLLHTNSTWIAN